jgi:hypothetical protein
VPVKANSIAWKISYQRRREASNRKLRDATEHPKSVGGPLPCADNSSNRSGTAAAVEHRCIKFPISVSPGVVSVPCGAEALEFVEPVLNEDHLGDRLTDQRLSTYAAVKPDMM